MTAWLYWLGIAKPKNGFRLILKLYNPSIKLLDDLLSNAFSQA